MEIDKKDDALIDALYRHYQQGRDNIKQSVLFKVKEAANAYVQETSVSLEPKQADYQAQVMQNIRDQAHKIYIASPVDHRLSTHEDSNTASRTGSHQKWRQTIRDFIISFNRPLLMGATASLLLVSLIVFKLMLPPANVNGLIAEYKSSDLVGNSVFVSEQILASTEWQHGFTMGDPLSREAFIAGMHMIDLVNLDSSDTADKRAALLQQFADIPSSTNNNDIQISIQTLQLDSQTDLRLLDLNAALEKHYLGQAQLGMYTFGKWLEFNYLHTKLALQLNNIDLFLRNIKQDHVFITEFARKGNYPQLVKLDVNQLVELYSVETVSVQHLEQRLKIFDKLRVVLH